MNLSLLYVSFCFFAYLLSGFLSCSLDVFVALYLSSVVAIVISIILVFLSFFSLPWNRLPPVY